MITLLILICLFLGILAMIGVIGLPILLVVIDVAIAILIIKMVIQLIAGKKHKDKD